MPTSSEPRIDDIPRIAFVTRRFHELQGLTPAVFGAYLILTSLMAHGMSRSYVASPLQAWNFAFGYFAITVIYMQRLYRQTFGDAVGTSRQQFMSGMPVLLVMSGSLADALVQVGRPAPSFAALGLAVWSSWIVLKDWPSRIHHLVPAAAGITAAMITSTAPALANRWVAFDPRRSEAYLLSFTVLGLGFVAAGLCDHWLLASSLAPRRPEMSGPQLALARADSGGTRAAIAAVICVAAGTTLWSVAPRLIPLMLPVVLWAVAGCVSLFAMFQISRAVRGGALAAAPRALKLYLGSDSLVLLFVMALAAASESAVGPPGVTVLAFAIGAASAWVAVRDWPYRGHYVIGAMASLAAVLIAARVDPARTLAVVVFATSGALMLEGLFDHFIATRHHRIEGLSDHEAVNVDTI